MNFPKILEQAPLSIIPKFCVEGLPTILDFGYFVLIRWQTDDK